MARRAIIVIPGLAREERNRRRDILVANMENVAVRTPVIARAEMIAPGLDGISLTVEDGSATREVDIFEAYWGDIWVESEPNTPQARLVEGFGLLGYWFVSPVWLAFLHNRTLTFGLLASGVLLLLWYVSVLILVSEAAIAGNLGGVEWLGPFGDLVTAVAQEIAGWSNQKYWFVVAGVLGAGMADWVARIAVFCRDYLTDKVNAEGTGLRSRIGKRVREVFNHVHAAGYDDVTVLGFSFGAVIAVDLLADQPNAEKLARTRLVTWGAPIVPLRYRSDWMDRELRALLDEDRIAGWDDYCSGLDWLGAPVPFHKAVAAGKTPPWKSERVVLEAGLWQAMTGESHTRYFQTQPVIEDLLA